MNHCPLRGLAIAIALVAATVATATATAAPRPTPAAAHAAADTAFAHADWSRAVTAYETIVTVEPANARAWSRLGSACYSLGRFERSALAWKTASATGYPAAIALYNAACAHARANQADSALAVLDRLMNAGYRQPQQLLDDGDFTAIRGDARFASAIDRARRNQEPCAYQPESRQLDFWIGDWDVTDNLRGHGPAGTSHVEAILGQCVIFENWSGRLGGNGKSFNAWNPAKRCWQQNWMDDSGHVTNYDDGHRIGERLEFLAEPQPGTPPGRTDRLTFFSLGPDHVRQLFDHSTDGGVTWVADTDLDYVRHR